MTGVMATRDIRPDSCDRRRLRISIQGAVQGVGFRPYVFQLAARFQLCGWVKNSSTGVQIEVEGPHLEPFLLALERERPPHSFIQSLEYTFQDARGEVDFKILESDAQENATALVLPDIATCPDCLRDIFDPQNRRYLYPFTNCTHCGPRFSIMHALPYDRHNTSMKDFDMCAACREEYENPRDRRFHAQPNACPACGPQLSIQPASADGGSPLDQAVERIRNGEILALKGLGGFQLIVDARNQSAVLKLRQRKLREGKPFALMAPCLDAIKALCTVSPLEERLLLASESPIVLLSRKPGTTHIAAAVAPGNPYLGIMLPYTPLHHLLMRQLGFPVVATSGNLADETLCIDEAEAFAKLDGIADAFLVHNRTIARHADDSIVRFINNREMVLRRARGYAPLPVTYRNIEKPVLAVGAHLKNTVAFAGRNTIFVSQHIGDMDSRETLDTFKKTIADGLRLFSLRPETVACDLHPHFNSSRYAQDCGLPVVQVQHHHAHILACMAENDLDGPALGIAWDGMGYGLDGTLWGGEFFKVAGGQQLPLQRLAHFCPFPLPGGERAIREPRRSAIGLLHTLYGKDIFSMQDLEPLNSFSANEQGILESMLEKNINCPRTSSAGRLFDAVASLIGLRQQSTFEGQAAMDLEFIVDDKEATAAYPFTILYNQNTPWEVNWKPMIQVLIGDRKSGVSEKAIAAKFHNTLAEIICSVAQSSGETRVVLSGGCFQNRPLVERTVLRLEQEGFRPCWHQRIPPNDGGIALGQAAYASWFNTERKS